MGAQLLQGPSVHGGKLQRGHRRSRRQHAQHVSATQTRNASALALDFAFVRFAGIARRVERFKASAQEQMFAGSRTLATDG